MAENLKVPSQIDNALALAKFGFSIFPLIPKNKMPFKDFKWRDLSTTDVDIITRWWAENPTANIAIDCGKSGLAIIDIDNPKVAKSLGLDEIKTLTCATSEGYHLFFLQNGNNITNSNTFPKGVDIRGNGGYVIAAGSIHPDGTEYEWTNELSITDYPDSLLQYVTSSNGQLQPKKASSQALEWQTTQYSQTTVKELIQTLSRIPDNDSYDNWFKVGMGCHHALGDAGLQPWIDWSSTSEKYKPGKCEKKWLSFKNDKANGVTYGTLKHMSGEIYHEPAQSIAFPAHPEKNNRPPRPMSYEQTITQPPKEWWVTNQFGQGDLCMLFGDSGAGKTFIMIDWMLDCMRGHQLMDDDAFDIIKPLKVLYITDEGNASFGQRVEAIGYHKGIHNGNKFSKFADNWLYLSSMLNVYKEGSELTKVERVLTEEEKIENKIVSTPFGWLVQDLNELNFTPQVIVIDTLANASGGSNEVDNSDAHIIAKNIKAIKKYFGECVVIFIHHTGKGRKDPRGASAYKQHCDVMWYAEKDENNDFGATISSFKIKDAERPTDKYCLREKANGWEKPYIFWTEQSKINSDKALAEKEKLISIIAANSNIDITNLMYHTQKSKKYLDPRLLKLELEGVITRTGKGVRNNPYFWNIDPKNDSFPL